MIKYLRSIKTPSMFRFLPLLLWKTIWGRGMKFATTLTMAFVSLLVVKEIVSAMKDMKILVAPLLLGKKLLKKTLKSLMNKKNQPLISTLLVIKTF
jgi:hypothetical protein